MDLKYVEEHTIFETVIGSRAYGIYNSDSDYDKAGVMIPDKSYFFGLDNFEQFTDFPDEDHTVYDIRKIVGLLADNNPNCLDLLFVPEHCITKITPFWKIFIENRDWFVSKRCKFTFSGYAISQLRRIKTHRKFLLNPPKVKPERADFNLKEVSIFPCIQLKSIMYSVTELVPEVSRSQFTNELDSIYGDYLIPLVGKYLPEDTRIIAMELLQTSAKSQAKALTSTDRIFVKNEYIKEAKNELTYYNAAKEWDQYQNWKKSRNKERAAIEEKFGYDCKHAGHLTRLLRMGKEILLTGQVNVDRTNIDAEELRSIRNGAWKYDQVEEYAEKMDKELEELYKTSKLRKSPESNKIKELLVRVVEEYLYTKNDMFRFKI